MEKRPRPYRRLDKSDRVAIENGLDKRKSCRHFDALTGRDCAALMSHINSEPRPSLGGMCAIDTPTLSQILPDCYDFVIILFRGHSCLHFLILVLHFRSNRE